MIKTHLTCNLLLACSLVIFALILSKSDLKAQNTVGIGTPTPNANAVLDLVSPNGNQGFLMPRISTVQRQGMASSLGSSETGLVVFDTDFKQFFHWVDTSWVIGLGSFSDIAGGDLQGSYPNPTLRSDVVNSATILDGSISSTDLADNSITSTKILDETITASDIGTDAIGSDEVSTGAVGSDEILDGAVTNTDLADDAVDSGKILDNTIESVDIATDAVGTDEIITGAVGSDEIADGSIQSIDIASGAIVTSNIADGTVETGDIASGGNNKVLITTAAGTVFWENITLFETSTLPEGHIFVGNVSNTAEALNAKGPGRILVGDGNSIQSLNINGDITLSATGNAQLNPNVIGSTEVADNSLTLDDLAPNAVAASELADNAVDNSAIQDNAVSTTKISDDAVTVAKINGAGVSDAILTTDGAGNPQWENKSGLDIDATNELQDLSLTANTLALTSDATTVDLSGYLDNTDSQNLSNVLGQGSGAGGSAITNVADPTNAQDVATKNYVDGLEAADNDGDPTNEFQDLTIAGNTLALTDDASTVDLSGYLDNTDSQDLTLASNTLALTGDASTVDLSGYLDNTDSQNLSNVLGQGSNAGGSAITNVADPTSAQDVATKNYVDGLEAADNDGDPTNEFQDLTIAGNTLALTDDASTVDLSGYLDNTDSQNLSNVLGQGSNAGGSAITNVADPTSAQDVATKNYVDGLEAADNDGDPTNEFQDLTIAGNTLALTNDASTVDLSGYLDNTDSQDLTLAGNTLGLTGDATTVDLSGYLDNTDSQNLSGVLGQGNDAGAVKIINVSDPTNPQDVATMNYVDNITIANGNLASNSVSTAEIIDGTIQQSDLANNSVGTAELRASSVTAAKIVNNAIINSKLAPNSVDSGNIINDEITNADINTTANISSSKLQSTVMVETEDVSLLNNDAGYLTSVNSASITDGSVVDADVSATANISSSKLQSTVMVETEDISLLNNDAGYLTSVNSASITDGSVVDADVSATANISSSKLQSTVMVETEDVSLLNNDAGYITTVTSADITDGTIVNVDVSGIAAIDGSKINPDFGSQNIQTTGSLNSGSATVSSLTVTDLAGANDTYTGDGAVNSFTISAGGVFSSSDVRLKTNIKDIPQALDKISRVEGKSYTFKSDHKEQIHFGVIAQDLMKLFPHLVRQNEDGYLSVNYLELIPVLIEALKEQQSTIQKLTIAMQREQELNYKIQAGLDKQRQLVRVQQFVLTQLQMDRAAMENDIKEIRQSLGLEAKKK